MMNKPLVIYHDNCADGFGAAFAAWLKLGDDAEYLPVRYGDVNCVADFPRAGQGLGDRPSYDYRDVYILDFSFPRDVMDHIFANAKRVVWLDHHASVFKDWAEGEFPAGAEIKLSNGDIAWVDPDDYERVSAFSWSKQAKGGAVAYTGGGRAAPKNEYMHHLILPQRDGVIVDHNNRNTLDNRRCNLRYASRSENGANMDRGSEFKGVTPHGSGFKAQITVNYGNSVIGTFPTAEEAARAYDAAARQQWGPFARTNFDQREPFPPTVHAVLDNNRSGAMLAWEYFHPDTEVPMLIRHIDDYDRWQFRLDGTKEFNKALWSYAPWSFEQWRDWVFQLDHNRDGPYLSDHITAPFIKEGAAILRAHDQNVQTVVKGAARDCRIELPMPNGGWRAGDTCFAIGLAANCPPHLTSDVGHELAVQSGTFGLCWQLAKEDKDGVQIANCSLRSNGDYDVSAIAKAFGGGGHKNAAGFEVPITTLLGWLG